MKTPGILKSRIKFNDGTYHMLKVYVKQLFNFGQIEYVVKTINGVSYYLQVRPSAQEEGTWVVLRQLSFEECCYVNPYLQAGIVAWH